VTTTPTTSGARGHASTSYAAEIARLLWPEPWGTPHVTRSRPGGDPLHRDAYLFPSPKRAHLLVPADVPGSADMLQRIGKGKSRFSGAVRVIVRGSVASRAFPLTRWPVLRVPGTDPAADSIERHLSGALGTDVRVGVMLGTRRANQKPVLQVFDRDGRLLAFAKVGHNDLTAALVRREAECLAVVAAAGPRGFHIPEVLDHATWNGLEVLVISALPVDSRRRVPEADRVRAMQEVAQLRGSTRVGLADSSFWTRLTTSIDALEPGLGSERLRTAATAIAHSAGDREVTLASWHGDWGHWNMGLSKGEPGAGELQVWDWERFDDAVPLGFDAVHFAAQRVRPGQREAQRQEEAFLGGLPAALDQLGVEPALHDLTLRLYLLEIVTRYVDALTHGPTPALQQRTAWALSLLERELRDADIPMEGRP